DGEVPGGDDADHAQRFARDLDADAGAHGGQNFAAGAQRFAGKELEDVAGAGDFADGLGQGLAFFAGQQVAEFGAARQDFAAHGIEDVKALLRGAERPGREGGLGGGNRVLGLGGVGLGVFAYQVARVRGVDVARDAGGIDPFAVHEVFKHFD